MARKKYQKPSWTVNDIRANFEAGGYGFNEDRISEIRFYDISNNVVRVKVEVVGTDVFALSRTEFDNLCLFMEEYDLFPSDASQHRRSWDFVVYTWSAPEHEEHTLRNYTTKDQGHYHDSFDDDDYNSDKQEGRTRRSTKSRTNRRTPRRNDDE